MFEAAGMRGRLRTWTRPGRFPAPARMARLWLGVLAASFGPATGAAASGQDQNAPHAWVYFDSRESGTGRPPQLRLEFARASHTVPAAADTMVISYLAERVWGGLPQLSISMNDTNRVLVRFDLTALRSTGALRKAELVLELHNSEVPIVAPFDLAVHRVTERWDEQTTNWDSQPASQKKPVLTLKVAPAEQTLRIDVTPVVRLWLSGTARNHGLLLKAAVPADDGRDAAGGGPVPELTPPPAATAPAEKLPWPHQAPGLSAAEAEKLNREVWIINNFPLYQADPDGRRRTFHSGLDIVLPNGTPIYAMKDGWVKSVDGATVVIADAQDGAPACGWAYTHLGDLQVKPREFVRRGTHIGNVAFHGLAHIHLEKAWCQGDHWGSWRYACAPDAHFTYPDSDPPVIRTPFLFFRNDTDDRFAPDESGRIVLSGAVDIVVGLRDAGQHARSSESGFGDRLAVAAIDYEIRPADGAGGTPLRRHSFDFRRLAIKHSAHNWQFNTALTGVVYKHPTLCESEGRTGDKVFSYYVITNCPGDGSPNELRLADSGLCWDTAAVDAGGKRICPDGAYDVIVRARDFVGNESAAQMRVTIAQRPAP